MEPCLRLNKAAKNFVRMCVLVWSIDGQWPHEEIRCGWQTLFNFALTPLIAGELYAFS